MARSNFMFLDLLEEIDAERATARSIFAGEGTSVTGVRRLRGNDPAYQEGVLRTVQMLADFQRGRVRRGFVEEAMSTSDFPLYFGDVIDRGVLGAFREFPSSYERFSRRETVADFRTAKRFALDGAEGVMEQVEQGADYPESSVTESKDEISAAKFGRIVPFTWETMINDDLQLFTDIVQRLGRAARRTMAKKVSGMYLDANGPHASLYTVGNKNIINTTNGASATNPALSFNAVMDGLLVLGQMRDTEGEPILFDAVTLVVPPALDIVARNILQAVEIRLKDKGGTSNEELLIRNWMSAQLSHVVDPYMPVIVTTGTRGNTSWALFGSPADGRPALAHAVLRGHEEPETFMESPNAIRVGGADAGAMEGSFDNDSIRYKVRYVCGAARYTSTGGFKSTVASNGTGA